jgi:hypothetical protein
VIFDHGVIHRSTYTGATKYVLRTDLLCKGIKVNKGIENSSFFNSLENLTCKLFRQAQLNELEMKPSGDLYERCLSLRMCPNSLTELPCHLLTLIESIPINKNILSSLRLISRDSSVYTFEYNTLKDNRFNIIKTAILFALNTLTVDITDQLIAIFNENTSGINVFSEKISTDCSSRVKKLINRKKEILEKSVTSISKTSTKKLAKINKELSSHCVKMTSNRSYFSNSMRKYNMLEDIPENFVRGLANVIRIRSKGTGRAAFDLTTSVLINDLNFKRMMGSKVSFVEGDTRFSDLPLNFFEKDFDSSLYATLKRLFVDFFLKYNSQYIKSLEFNELGKIIDNFPVNTVIQLIGKQYSLNIVKTRYSYHNSHYYNTQNVNEPNAFCFNSFKFVTTIGETQLNFHNVTFNKGTISGRVTIDSPTRYFNHAACQSDVVDSYVRNIKEVDGKTTMKYIILEHTANFVMTSDRLVITIVPNVVL